MSEMINQTPQPEEYSMKWHNFLIYFALWAGAVLGAINGFSQITGSVYGDKTELVYDTFPSLKGFDVLFGVIIIALAVYQIYTRFQLAGYKQDAPKKLTIVYAANFAISVLYLFIVSSATGVPISQLTSESFWGSLAGCVAMIVVNKKYYENRSALFVNRRPDACSIHRLFRGEPGHPIR